MLNRSRNASWRAHFTLQYLRCCIGRAQSSDRGGTCPTCVPSYCSRTKITEGNAADRFARSLPNPTRSPRKTGAPLVSQEST